MTNRAQTATVAVLVVALLALGLAFLWPVLTSPSPTPIANANANGPISIASNFTECANAGFPVQESYPRQCRTPDGRTFTEDIGDELQKVDLIKVTDPRPNATVTSPLTVRGVARGNWYFEASFPVELLDAAGSRLAQVPAQAQGEWMTQDFVPFTATLTFTAPTSSTGTLWLRKDNPSGLPQNDDALRLPVRFR